MMMAPVTDLVSKAQTAVTTDTKSPTLFSAESSGKVIRVNQTFTLIE